MGERVQILGRLGVALQGTEEKMMVKAGRAAIKGGHKRNGESRGSGVGGGARSL